MIDTPSALCTRIMPSVYVHLAVLGPKCHTPFDSCASVHCHNNGTCVSLDERTISHVCVCPPSHFGDQCQFKTAQLTLTIPSSNISHIPVLLIHFLQSPAFSPGILMHQDLLFFRNIRTRTQLAIDIIDQSLVSPFVFAQFLLGFLIHLRSILSSVHVESKPQSSGRCLRRETSLSACERASEFDIDQRHTAETSEILLSVFQRCEVFL